MQFIGSSRLFTFPLNFYETSHSVPHTMDAPVYAYLTHITVTDHVTN